MTTNRIRFWFYCALALIVTVADIINPVSMVKTLMSFAFATTLLIIGTLFLWKDAE